MGNPDVVCVMGTSSEKIPSDQRADCLAMGGTIYDPNSIDPNKGTGICFVRDILTRALSERILRLGGTYQLALDFRDEILEKLPKGKRLLRLYYRHVPDLFNAVAKDPRLLLTAIEVWQNIWLFAEAMLQVSRGLDKKSGQKLNPAKYKLSPGQHRKVKDFAKKLNKQTTNKAFRVALTEFSKEWEKYAGADTQQALRILGKRR